MRISVLAVAPPHAWSKGTGIPKPRSYVPYSSATTLWFLASRKRASIAGRYYYYYSITVDVGGMLLEGQCLGTVLFHPGSGSFGTRLPPARYKSQSNPEAQ